MDLSKLSKDELMAAALAGFKSKALQKKHADRARAKQMILVRKALKAGITASEAEIDAEVKAMAARKK